MARMTNGTIEIAEGLVPVVVTLFGPDRQGVTATTFALLARHNAQLLDVEQSLFRGRLSLAAYAAMKPEEIDGLAAELEATLGEYQPQVEKEKASASPRSTHVAVVLGNPVTASDLKRIGETITSYGANIDRIRGISEYPLTGLELFLSLDGSGVPLRKALATLTSELDVDVAIERAGLHRRSTRLVCFDCDSTLITGEVIEMLAAHAGKEEEVAEVTARAMRGEIDFEESLRQRVATLKGLDASIIEDVIADITLTPGARTTITTLKKMGYTTAVVSGGFNQVLDPVAKELGIDYARANELEIVDGKLTGQVLGEVVDRMAKARFLREFAALAGLRKEQTVAVGDGANDIDMISAAGLGIAFNAKPVLRKVADASVNHPFLDEVLYILGVPRGEIEESQSHL